MRQFKFLKNDNFAFEINYLAEWFAREVWRAIKVGEYNREPTNTWFPIRQRHHGIGTFKIDSIQHSDTRCDREYGNNVFITISCAVEFIRDNRTYMPRTINVEWNETV